MNEQFDDKVENVEDVQKAKRPSCLLEMFVFFLLSTVTLIGITKIIGPYLDNLANSMFGMGLK